MNYHIIAFRVRDITNFGRGVILFFSLLYKKNASTDICKITNVKICTLFDSSSINLQILFLFYIRFNTILKIYSSFKSLILGKDSTKLDEWISNAKEANIDSINSYIEVLSKEKNAVINAIDMANNNGIAEGKVNLIKLIKRVMYGRCKFDTLKTKILLHEFEFEIV